MQAPQELINAYKRADEYAQEVYLKSGSINGFAKTMGNRRLCVAHVSFRFRFAVAYKLDNKF